MIGKGGKETREREMEAESNQILGTTWNVERFTCVEFKKPKHFIAAT
jgi:hypothetical protein